MSRNRLALSALLAWHVFALALADIPFPGIDPLPAVALSRHVADDPIAARVSPVLDGLSEQLAPRLGSVLSVARPVRRAVDVYLGTLRLGQHWGMFGNPPVVDQYVKVRYYVGSTVPGLPARVTWTATELVLPAHREDQIRSLQSFWDSSRDKALAIALDDFNAKLAAYVDKEGRLPRRLPDDLAPIGRYFGRRFARTYLKSTERLVRAEVWYGEVPNPVRGVALAPSALEARLNVLRSYYGGPVRGPALSFGTLAYGSSEEEADIKWKLKYFEDL